MTGIVNWKDHLQKGLNDTLSRAVRNGTVDDVKDALHKGADPRAWDCYMLTVALGKLEYNPDTSKVILLCDAMFGPAAYPALVALQSLGCDSHDITKMMLSQYGNKNTTPIVPVDVPGDFL